MRQVQEWDTPTLRLAPPRFRGICIVASKTPPGGGGTPRACLQPEQEESDQKGPCGPCRLRPILLMSQPPFLPGVGPWILPAAFPSWVPAVPHTRPGLSSFLPSLSAPKHTTVFVLCCQTLAAVKMKVAQSCPALAISWTIRSMEFSRPGYWSA